MERKKVNALDAHESQVYEWLPWIGGYAQEVPADKTARKKWLAARMSGTVSPEVRLVLEKYYGKEKAAAVKYAEAFEICEYGTQPKEEDIRRLFPMLK